MSFRIGTSSSGMGPRGAISEFGREGKEGRLFDWRVVSRLLAFLRPYGRRMVLAFVLMLLSTGLTLLTPYLLKVAIDNFIAVGDSEGLAAIALVTLAAFGGLYLTTTGERYLLSWVGQRVLADMRDNLFRRLQMLGLVYHDTHIVGVTVSRVINDVAVINQLLSEGLIALAGDMLVLGGIVVIMWFLSPQLAALTFTTLPIMILVTMLFSRHAKVAFRRTRTTVARLIGNLAEDIAGMRVIQAFAQEERVQERFKRINDDNRQAHVDAMALSYIFLPSVEVMGTLATAIVLLFGGLGVINGSVTIGVLVAFLAYVSRFFQPIQELSRVYTTMQSAMAGGEQVVRLLDTEPEPADRPGARVMPEIVGRVALENVSFAYREGLPVVLRDLDLVIEPGQTVALVGPTGAGKTSIANLVSRFYDVTSGAVLIDGIDVRDVEQRSLRRQMGLVSQDPLLFSGEIGENIRFGRPDAGDDEVELAARAANAHDFIQALPEGYRTPILEGGVNLSLGQRQLLCIARAILADPRILIMDEATANVDTVTESLIQEALDRLYLGRTSIIVAHRLSTIQKADLICVISDGRIVERGTHASLLTCGELYPLLHSRQFVLQNAGD